MRAKNAPAEEWGVSSRTFCRYVTEASSTRDAEETCRAKTVNKKTVHDPTNPTTIAPKRLCWNDLWNRTARKRVSRLRERAH